MDPYLNPYRPGAGTQPRALVGRDALIDRFGITIRRALHGQPGKSLMPIGLRGVGKTVLLNRFAEIAGNEGYVVGSVEAPDDESFVIRLAGELRRLLLDLDRVRKASAAVSRALSVLKSFTYHFPDGTSISLGVQPLAGYGDSGDLTRDLTDVLVAAGQAAGDRGQGLLLSIDELQYLSRKELGALITAIHRTTQLDLPVVLVGAGLPQLPGLAGEAKSYAERLFDFPMIGSLDAADARAALEVPARELDVEFADGALDLLVSSAQGYPYFLQEWGSHAWNAASISPIKREDVLAVADAVQHQLDENFFRVRFDRLTPREKDYLRAMAELGQGPHRSGSIARELGIAVESAGPMRSNLIGKGMIYSPGHGETAFTVPLFDQFIRRAMPTSTPRRRTNGRTPQKP
jgi:hypothetical protein